MSHLAISDITFFRDESWGENCKNFVEDIEEDWVQVSNYDSL
jgi:hypothetical protein